MTDFIPHFIETTEQIVERGRRGVSHWQQPWVSRYRPEFADIHRMWNFDNFMQRMLMGPPTDSAFSHERVPAADYIMKATGAKIRHGATDSAYRSSTDEVRLPLLNDFVSRETYYSTVFHELGHWTGHPSRLNRPYIMTPWMVGDREHAVEEITAELTGAYISNLLGVCNLDHCSAYIGNKFICHANGDLSVLQEAAQQAVEASSLILNLAERN